MRNKKTLLVTRGGEREVSKRNQIEGINHSTICKRDAFRNVRRVHAIQQHRIDASKVAWLAKNGADRAVPCGKSNESNCTNVFGFIGNS